MDPDPASLKHSHGCKTTRTKTFHTLQAKVRRGTGTFESPTSQERQQKQRPKPGTDRPGVGIAMLGMPMLPMPRPTPPKPILQRSRDFTCYTCPAEVSGL